MKKKTRRKVQIANDLPTCPCGLEAKDELHATFFSWQNINGKVDLVCWDCAYKLHREAMKND